MKIKILTNLFIFFVFLCTHSTIVWAVNGVEEFGSNDLNAVVNKFNEIKKRNPNIDFKLRGSEEVEVKTCVNCPRFLNLASSINSILEKASKDPKFEDDELPSKVKKLKMIYYVVKKREADGSVRCQTFDNGNFIFDRDAKMEGQAKLISEQAFSIPSLESLTLNREDTDQLVYYFRDPDQKNVLVQVVQNKNQNAVIRYYSYTPTEKEKNPYNLPDLGETPPKKRKDIRPIEIHSEENTADLKPTDPNNYFNYKFDTKVEKRGFLPRDVKLMDASVSKELLDGFILRGENETRLARGNETSLKLTDGTREYVAVAVRTKLNGTVEHSVIVPYKIDLGSVVSDTAVAGAIQDETNARSVSVSLTDKNIDVIRAVVRENKTNGRDSIIISKDFNFESNGVLSVNGGVDEEKKKFVGLRHAVNLNKTTSMAMDLKLDSQRHATFYYTLSSQF